MYIRASRIWPIAPSDDLSGKEAIRVGRMETAGLAGEIDVVEGGSRSRPPPEWQGTVGN